MAGMSFPLDYHTHTHFSCDSQAPMGEMCRAALALGLPEIGFAEHFDNVPQDSGCGFFRLEAWAAALEACRRQYDGQLTVLGGIEIGEPHVYPAEVTAILARYPFDYAIGSLHWVGAGFTFAPEFFQRPADEAYRRYFEELEEMTRLGEFDILGHFEVVARMGYTVYGEYDPLRYEEPIRAVLQNCIARGIALELNTWSVRRGHRRITPAPEVLRWYRQMGGERVTLGSDAHEPERIAEDFDTAVATLREAGFGWVTQFRRRQAAMRPLV
jgi:histidinol-phosphatase (PHP family)